LDSKAPSLQVSKLRCNENLIKEQPIKVTTWITAEDGVSGARLKLQPIDKSHHHMKDHVEIGCWTKFGAFKVNSDQVMDLETRKKAEMKIINMFAHF